MSPLKKKTWLGSCKKLIAYKIVENRIADYYNENFLLVFYLLFYVQELRLLSSIPLETHHFLMIP